MLNRRKFFERTLLGGAFAYFPLVTKSMDLIAPFESVDVEIKLKAVVKKIQIKPGKKTKVFSYEGELIKGRPENLIPSNSYLGPTIQLNKGQRVRIHFENELESESIIHWHGLDVPSKADGHPRDAVEQGESYAYDFIVEDRAGLYWYHPHPHGKTGYQVYMGLAGLFIVRDEQEMELNLPSNDRELIYAFQDRDFKVTNELNYRPSMMGASGRDILINGQKKSTFEVKPGPYRLRILNGCNSRIFKLSFKEKIPFIIMGVDGGLLRNPEEVKELFFSPGERLDIWMDFSKVKNGSAVKLYSVPIVKNSRRKAYQIMKFKVQGEEDQNYDLPNNLSNYESSFEEEAINRNSPKKFELGASRSVGWSINGRGYQMNEVLDLEKCKLGTKEIWEFENKSGMPHPMHIHGSSFEILKRENSKYPGSFDKGRKDIVLVMPGEKVSVIKSFEKHSGLFVYHCHNLEHEDMSMMRNFLVE